MPGLVMPDEALAPSAEIYQVIDPSGRAVSSLPNVPEEVAIRIYRTMVLVRLLDERMMILQRQGRIGFYGACTGQEAPPVATAAALRDTDWIFPGLREGAAMLFRDYPLESYISQVFGNLGDPQKGRQMPSHQADASVRQVSWSSCIGTQIPHAVGAASAVAAAGEDTVCVAFFGDGATSTSDFHCGMHFATVQNAPCLFVCQNNHWSISVPVNSQTRSRTLADRASAYGIPAARVDGNDALAVFAAAEEAAGWVRGGRGPAFLELVTYRVGPHSSSDDPRVYRDAAEVEAWKVRDPIERLRHHLVESGVWDHPREVSLKLELSEKIRLALVAAETYAKPHRSSLFEDVYSETRLHKLGQAANE